MSLHTFDVIHKFLALGRLRHRSRRCGLEIGKTKGAERIGPTKAMSDKSKVATTLALGLMLGSMNNPTEYAAYGRDERTDFQKWSDLFKALGKPRLVYSGHRPMISEKRRAKKS